MISLISHLNAAGESFVRFALPMLIQSSLLILILLVLELILRPKTRSALRYGLWMLVLVKLMLPSSLAAPTGIGYWVGGSFLSPSPHPGAPAAQAAGLALMPPARPAPLPDDTLAAPDQNPTAEAGPLNPSPSYGRGWPEGPGEGSPIPAHNAASPAPPLTWQAFILLAWGAIAAAMLLLLLQRAFFVRGLIAAASPAGTDLLAALDHCRQRMSCRQPIALKISDLAASPAVCGLFRPVILIPRQLAGKLEGARLEAVLLHELAHLKRGDLWVNCLQALLQIAYFYNPLLWLANAVIRRLREQAVDEMVLVTLGAPPEEYSAALVDVARLSLRRPALSLRLVGVVESPKALTQRIRLILTRPIPKSARLGLAGGLFVLIAGALLLPMAKGQGLLAARPRPAPQDQATTEPVASGASSTAPRTEAPRVAGRVVDRQGNPVAGAEVLSYEFAGYSEQGSTVRVLDQAATDAQGVFSLVAPQNDRRILRGNVVGFKPGLAVDWAQPEIPSGSTGQVTLVLGPAATLGGTIVDEAGSPVPGASVEALLLAPENVGVHSMKRLWGRPSKWLACQTDKAGRFEFVNLPREAGVDLRVLAPGFAAVTTRAGSEDQASYRPGQTDIRLVLAPEARISGKVVHKETGAPVAGVLVMASNPPAHQGGLSDAQGRFTIANLPAGKTTLRLGEQPDSAAEWILEAEVSVETAAGGTTQAVLQVIRGGVLEIAVTDQAGRPISQRSVYLEGKEPARAYNLDRTDANGVGTIRLQPGTYQLSNGSSEGYVPEPLTSKVKITEGGRERLELRLQPLPTLRGVLRDPQGRPVEGAIVELRHGSRTVSQADGAYEVRFEPNFEREMSDGVLLVRHPARNLAACLDVAPVNSTLDVQLAPAATIAGRVTDPNGSALPGAVVNVLLHWQRFGFTFGRTMADAQGRFLIAALAPGQRYEVTAQARGSTQARRQLRISDNQSQTVDFGTLVLAPTDQRVSGVVVDKQGSPVKGAQVKAQDKGYTQIPTVVTDEAGKFDIRGVPAAPIVVWATLKTDTGHVSASAEVNGGDQEIRLVLGEDQKPERSPQERQQLNDATAQKLRTTRLSAHFDDISFGDALQVLRDDTGLTVGLRGDVPRDGRLRLEFENVTAEEYLRKLLEMVGGQATLVYQIRNGDILIQPAGNAGTQPSSRPS